MQYLLDETEMREIRALRERERALPDPDELAAVVAMVATTMVPTEDTPEWPEGKKTPYGCIHINRRASYGYCDRCPVQTICKLPKDYSK